MNCKTKFDIHNTQAIEYEGEAPKSNSDLIFGGNLEKIQESKNKKKI